MTLYQISELEQLTGIKAHTIRIWEKRYNLITPTRTSTNIRRYDDEQVRKLLNVTTLLNKGYKISKIAALKEREINQEVTLIQESNHTDSVSTTFINDLIIAMLDFNEHAFEKTYSAAITRFGLFDAMLNVFYPLLYKIGVMWTVNDAMPVQEHFASCILKRKIMAATDGLSLPTKKKKKFLLLLPPGEFHEMGLLFANYIIRSKGFETIYLGSNVPYENIKAVLKQTNPDYLLSFFVTNQDVVEIKQQLKKHFFNHKHLTVLISGHSLIIKQLKKQKNFDTLLSPNDLLNYL